LLEDEDEDEDEGEVYLRFKDVDRLGEGYRNVFRDFSSQVNAVVNAAVSKR
jgi:hypothetical protein